MSGFKVIHPGIFTLIQDNGRFGFASLGVTSSGAMDEYAYHYANKLLDNSLGTNVLEIAFSGLSLKATANTMISLTGADLTMHINGKACLPWQTFVVKKDDEIVFKKSISGQRAYLAVQGGFDIKKEFGSNSTTLKEELGGLNGTQLKKGDFLPFKPSKHIVTQRLKQQFIPDYAQALTLRVLLGYQEASFKKTEKEKFFSSTFCVSNESNRMGVKLEGEKVYPTLDGVISEGICFGAIQIPKSGQPIILLKDRQTIGGYAKIGSVLGIDCFKLSQAKANTQVTFKEIDLEEATLKTKRFYQQFT